MDELVKQFIEQKQAEIYAAEQKKVEEYLLNHGLYREIGEREYTTAANPGEEYNHYDPEKKQWYKAERVVVSVSEEDLNALHSVTDKMDVIYEEQWKKDISSLRKDIHLFKVIMIVYIILSLIDALIVVINM